MEISKLAGEALAVADIAIFTGRFASAALRSQQAEAGSRLFAMTRSRDIVTFLRSIHQEGDLIVIKGSNKIDHLRA
jgi:UDP-N-acetylmuramyl pentapeptide synthase